jgi:hypothetical protein
MSKRLRRLTLALVCLCISFLILNTPSAAEKMKFKLASGGNSVICGRVCGAWAMAQGDITPASYLELSKFLEEQQLGKDIKFYMNSNGGSLLGGLMLGQVLRAFEANVSIGTTSTHRYTGESLRILNQSAKSPYNNPNWKPDESYFLYDNVDEDQGVCLSACAYAFLGGAQREVPGKAKLGFHQFFSEETIRDPLSKQFTSYDLSQQQQLTALVADYVGKMGVDTFIVTLASQTPPTNMYVLEGDELIKYRVITVGEIQGDWKLDAFGNGLFLSKTSIVQNNAPRPPKRTLGFYCKSDHPNDWIAVYIHDFGYQRDTDQPWPESIVSSVSVTAGPFQSSVNQGGRGLVRSWVTKEGEQAIAVYLQRNAFLAGLRNATKVSVWIQLPRSHGLSAGGDFDAHNLAHLLGLVSKNCAS